MKDRDFPPPFPLLTWMILTALPLVIALWQPRGAEKGIFVLPNLWEVFIYSQCLYLGLVLPLQFDSLEIREVPHTLLLFAFLQLPLMAATSAFSQVALTGTQIILSALVLLLVAAVSLLVASLFSKDGLRLWIPLSLILYGAPPYLYFLYRQFFELSLPWLIGLSPCGALYDVMKTGQMPRLFFVLWSTLALLLGVLAATPLFLSKENKTSESQS